MVDFIGRTEELNSLALLAKKKVPSLVVIKGRWRIGKSRLVEEYARKYSKRFISLSGLAPATGTTLKSQLDDFMAQLGEQMGLSGIHVEDWVAAFRLLANAIKTGRVTILLDEISWMGSKDPDFLGKLKTAWDLYFKKNPQLVLILCGSVSSWIEKNIISSTGFFGRISLKITLNELTLSEADIFLSHLGVKCSIPEKMMILSITGGIPWYLELFNPGISVQENIKKLCFDRDGQLVEEFRHIFHDLFGRRGEIYKKIVKSISSGSKEYLEIAQSANLKSSGSLSEYLEDLILAGFIEKDFSWNLRSIKNSRLCKYRLRDNYLRFYLKYILGNFDKISKGEFNQISLSSLPGLHSILGLQFENLVLNNRKLIHQELGIRPEDIAYSNPYFQRQTSTHSGCQIDYMVQNKYGTLFVCEIKFSIRPVGSKAIKEVKEKISRLDYPRGFAPNPVLIHCNGVEQKVIDSGYFTIIDFSKFITSN